MEKITVGIYGLGLIGGSIALAVKSFIPGSRVIGFGRDQEKLEKAKRLGIIDKYGDENSEVVGELDFFIIGTPVIKVSDVFFQYINYLSEDVIVMDVGSVKRPVIEGINKVNHRGLHFVSAHPMAGSEKSGLEFARYRFVQQKNCGGNRRRSGRNYACCKGFLEDFWGADCIGFCGFS